MDGLLLANFGGPRTLEEVKPFLRALLSDQEMIRTPWPSWLHRMIFYRVADKRTPSLRSAYETIGGSSPIFADTEYLASVLRERLAVPVLAFHRYLESTHENALQAIENLEAQRIVVLPLFAHFSYATTGSIAALLARSLPSSVTHRLSWIRSYGSHESFLSLWERRIRKSLALNQIEESNALLLFSAHGLPRRFIEEGDSYEREVSASFLWLKERFYRAECVLAFQSKFGKEPWLEPSTLSICENLVQKGSNKYVLIIPISFTSDHIETLYEIEKEYIAILRHGNIKALRLDAFNRDSDWVESAIEIIRDAKTVDIQSLMRY